MYFLVELSNYLIPFVIFFVVCYGLIKNVDVFDAFISGAKDGVGVILTIFPTLLGLLVAVGMLRASGGIDGIIRLLSPLLGFTDFPTEAIPVALLRTFSSSASMSLIIDIFEQHGPDSFIGRLVSIIAGCTESIFYTLSVYFMSVHIKKTRYTVPVALLTSLAGIITAYQLTHYLFN